MTPPDLIVLAFTVFNSVRVLAYVPQIFRISRDRGGAVAISCWTWSLFALSHMTTVAYTIVVAEDLFMALMFGASTVGCATIVALTCIKRR